MGSQPFRALISDLSAFAGWRLAAAVGMAALAAGLEGLCLMMLVPLLNVAGVTGAEGFPTLAPLGRALGLGGMLAAWVAAVAAHTAFNYRREAEQQRLVMHFIGFLRRRLHHAVLGMDWAAFQTLRSSDVVAALTVTANRISLGVAAIVQGTARLLVVVAHCAIALWVAPGAALLALAAGAVLAATQLPGVRRTLHLGRRLGQGNQQIHAVLSEHVAALKLAKAHNAEPAFADAFAQEVARQTDDSLRLSGGWLRGRAWQRAAAALLVAAVAWCSVRLMDVTGPQLLLLVAVFARLMPAVADAAHSVLRLTEILPAYGELEALRRRCMPAPAPPAAPTMAPLAGALVLDGVSYTWPGRVAPAVDGVSLTIPERGTLALVGPSGAGKSTLADLCLGLLAPERGTVSVGGTALDGAARTAWRERVAVVPQDVFLFNASVRDNLARFHPQADEEQMWQALDAAAAADLVRRLPEGLDTVLGDRGVRLSGGERQRLALARALLRRPTFLVLDEATSHLDREHELRIQDSLERLHGRLAVLVIAHRLSTVRHADTIVVLDGGRVVESGGWDQLAEAGGWLGRAAAL